jgi:hypothetical protein
VKMTAWEKDETGSMFELRTLRCDNWLEFEQF